MTFPSSSFPKRATVLPRLILSPTISHFQRRGTFPITRPSFPVPLDIKPDQMIRGRPRDRFVFNIVSYDPYSAKFAPSYCRRKFFLGDSTSQGRVPPFSPVTIPKDDRRYFPSSPEVYRFVAVFAVFSPHNNPRLFSRHAEPTIETHRPSDCL